MILRKHIRELQILENKAAEKAGMRFLLMDENELMGKKSQYYIKGYIKQLETDISPEVIAAARMGTELNEEIT